MRREPTFDDGRFDPHAEGSCGDLRVLAAPRPSGRFRLASRLVLAAAAIAGLATLASERTDALRAAHARAGSSAAAASARPAKPAAAATPLLSLDDTSAQADPPRWNPATGLREDGLSQGRFDAIEAPFLRLTLTETAPGAAREGEPSEPGMSLFVTLARRAAQARGLSVLRTGLRGALDTKFGRFETVETTLGGEGERRCTGFASLGPGAVRIDGWLCGVLGAAPEPQAVICALDRLRLAVPAAPPVEIAFGEAELHRQPVCAGTAGREAETGATGSITGPNSGRKGTADEPRSRRLRKNMAEARRNA